MYLYAAVLYVSVFALEFAQLLWYPPAMRTVAVTLLFCNVNCPNAQFAETIAFPSPLDNDMLSSPSIGSKALSCLS